VLTPEGDVLAEHELGHDHASEQPFTRTSGPFTIPDEVTEVVIEGRDQQNGYGGKTVAIAVPRSRHLPPSAVRPAEPRPRRRSSRLGP